MKKILALTVALLMLVTTLSPMQSFAAADDKGLEKAIKVAKSLIDIPDGFKLESSFASRDDIKAWDLHWRSKDDDSGSVNASISEDGTLLWYNRYKPEYYNDRQRKFPKVSKEEATTIAEAFINKVKPSILSNVKYNEELQNPIMNSEYYFNYTRLVNDVPYYDNSVNVAVNKNTGDVISYNYNWTDKLEFPDATKAISIEEAQEAYSEKLGLELIYRSSRDKDKLKTFAIYVPKYNNYAYGIDAITGEKIDIATYYGPYYNTRGISDMAMKEDSGGGGYEEIILSPEEEKEIQEISGLMSIEEVEKIVRNSSAVGLDNDNLELENYGLSRSWNNREEITWNLNFRNKPNKDNKEEHRYANLMINARTGEIQRFYIENYPYNEEEKPEIDQAGAKAAVEKFLKEFKPDKYDLVEFKENERDNIIISKEDELPRMYWFRFTRKVNGVPFPDNGFSITYDAVNQKVTEFSMNWYDVVFPSVAGALPVDKMNEILFEKVGLELQYKGVFPEIDTETDAYIDIDFNKVKPEIKLVYVLKSDKPLDFDAYSGDIVNYDGTLYKEYKPVEYTDIEGHYAQNQINMLAEYGIALEGSEFKPNQQIMQKEFFILLTQTMNYYYSAMTEQDIDNMYKYLIREKIITTDEKEPEAFVKREDSIKYIIKSLKFNEVAEIKGIYNCPFTDKDQIDPDLVGYVTIAYGMNIVNGFDGNVNPKGEMTRAEAATMIYNYLKR